MVEPRAARNYGPQKKPTKAEQLAMDKRRRELLADKQTWDARKREQFQNELSRQKSRQFYQDFNQRMDTAPPSQPIQYRDTLSPSLIMDGPQLATIAPGDNDPLRAPRMIGNTTPRGMDLSKPAAPEGPSPAIGMGAGGPDQPADPARPWLNDPIVGQEPQGTQATPDRPWANDPIVGAAPEPRKPTGDINDMINEAANMIPGGYGKWAVEQGLAVADPLSKEGYTYKSQARGGDVFDAAQGQPDSGGRNNFNIPLPFGNVTLPMGFKDDPWNEQVATILKAGADTLLEPLDARNTGGEDQLVDAAKNFIGGSVKLPAALASNPHQAIAYDYNPIYQLGMGYKSMEDAGGDAIEGNWDTAGQKALQGANELAMGALAFTPLKGKAGGAPVRSTTLAEARRAAADTSAALRAPVPAPVQKSAGAVPSVKQAGRTLAATAVPGRRMRPQAVKAIERILVASNVPRDRIAAGLSSIIKGLEGGVDGQVAGSARAPTVAQLIEREFGQEFPEVAQNLRTVLLERRLTKTRKDISPTIIRDAAQEMRGSQVPFLQESASRNLGDTARTSTRADVEANLKQIGEEGYSPIVKQQAEPERAKAIQDVLNGPGMNELGRPLRQIAAGEGIDIETMIAQRPIEAAHWMQHKARLLAEENSGTTLGNAYNAMRSRILGTIDDLKAPTGETYAQIRAKYGDEAGIKDALTAGDRFGAIVRNPDGANQFIAKFNEATPDQQAAQLASIRDWAESKLRGGGEEGASRLTELQSIAVLDTLDRLGPQGKALADDIRAIRDEEKFLGGFYPKSESATANNLTAIGQGADIYSRPGASSMPGNAMADAALMASGFSSAPILTAMRQGPKLYRGIMQPKVATREDMTRILMSRPPSRASTRARSKPGTGAPVPPSPVVPPAPVSALPESMRLASARLKDGSTQDVVADVFTDRGVVVVSPSWPTNAGNDLLDALISRSNELRGPRKGLKVVDEKYAPPAPREPSPKWSSQNPEEMADLTKQVADRFIGLSRNGDAHVLALTDEVDANSLASYLEANIPSSKQLVATRDGGEIAIVSKRFLRDNADQFAAPTWEPLYPSYNQGKGLRPAPADWAKPPKKPN